MEGRTAVEEVSKKEEEVEIEQISADIQTKNKKMKIDKETCEKLGGIWSEVYGCRGIGGIEDTAHCRCVLSSHSQDEDELNALILEEAGRGYEPISIGCHGRDFGSQCCILFRKKKPIPEKRK